MGHVWITDEIKEKVVPKDFKLPEGWRYGRSVKMKVNVSRAMRMKHYTRLYMDHFGYGIEDFVKCELTGLRAVDIHHINSRGMGGSKKRDSIDNLMALTRHTHLIYGDNKKYLQFLIDAHKLFLDTGIPYIDSNPHHKFFDDLMINDELIKLIKWKRLS